MNSSVELFSGKFLWKSLGVICRFFEYNVYMRNLIELEVKDMYFESKEWAKIWILKKS